jgi:hypothetical protein
MSTTGADLSIIGCEQHSFFAQKILDRYASTLTDAAAVDTQAVILLQTAIFESLTENSTVIGSDAAALYYSAIT